MRNICRVLGTAPRRSSQMIRRAEINKQKLQDSREQRSEKVLYIFSNARDVFIPRSRAQALGEFDPRSFRVFTHSS